jgi:Emfourin
MLTRIIFMRRNLSFLLLFVLLLAACGGSPTAAPTANNAGVDQTTAPTAEAATPVPATVAPREYSTAEATLPIPGTLSAPATEDPDAGKVFDTLTFARTGGVAAQPLNIQLTGAGVLTRDGAVSQLSADQVAQIVKVLDEINFFGLDGVFTAPGTSADAYHYELTVERDGASRTLKAEDGFIPPELAQLIGQISALGQ